MPGVLQVEAMAQVGGLLVLNTIEDPEKYSTYFMKIDNVKFRQRSSQVIPLSSSSVLLGDDPSWCSQHAWSCFRRREARLRG